MDSQLRIRGRSVSKPYVSQNDCAVVLAVTRGGKILLIKSYRPEMDGYVYEIPAGTLKDGERPEACARRELAEETGYTAKKIVRMFSGYPLLGYSDCELHFFLATGLKKGRRRMEKDESIFVEEFEVDEAINMFKEGRIADLNALTVLYFFRAEKLGVD